MEHKTRTLVWVLSGALVMSCALNVAQWLSAPRAPTLSSVQDLGLSEAQLAQLSECCSDCCGAGASIRADIAAEQAELDALLASPDADPAEVSRLTDRVGALRRELYENGIETVQRVRTVLSPDQLATLRTQCCPPNDQN